MLRIILGKIQMKIMKLLSRFYEIFYTLRRYLNERPRRPPWGIKPFHEKHPARRNGIFFGILPDIALDSL